MPETINTICWRVAMEVAKPSLVYPPLSYAHQQCTTAVMIIGAQLPALQTNTTNTDASNVNKNR